MNVKSDLKNIIRENLDKASSSIFIDKSLSIIDESAESMESLLAAADRVNKRIALFIDTELARKVFNILRLEIENRELTPGTRRRHVRVAACNKAYVAHNSVASELYTENISVEGVSITTKAPFPVGSKVVISLPLETGSHINLKGVVSHIKYDVRKNPIGMGIEFREVRDDERKMLSDFLKKMTEQNILEITKED